MLKRRKQFLAETKSLNEQLAMGQEKLRSNQNLISRKQFEKEVQSDIDYLKNKIEELNDLLKDAVGLITIYTIENNP